MKARFQFGNVIHDFRSEEIHLNVEYFFNPKSLLGGVLPMGRNCLTCLKIGHKTKDCPVANNNRKERNQTRRVYSESFDDANSQQIVCYRCRKSGHMARDCQDPIYEKRLNQRHIPNASNNPTLNGANNNQANSTMPNNSNKLLQNTLVFNKYCGDRCFTCNGFGHLSRDCKTQVTFTAKSQQQQQQTYMMASNQSHSLMHQQQMHQQSAPMPKIIRIDHMPQARHVNPPILLQSGEEKYHLVVNKSAPNNLSSSNGDNSSAKSKIDHHSNNNNVITNYQNFFNQTQQNSYNLSQQQHNRQNSSYKTNTNSNKNTASNGSNGMVSFFIFY